MTRPRLQVTLSQTEDETLLEVRKATTIPQRTKDRAEMLRLNHRGWTTAQIAEYFDCQVATVRKAIYRWQSNGLYGLWDLPRSGRPRKWTEADLVYLEETIEQTPETLNSRHLTHRLKTKRQVELSRRHLCYLLKKRAIDGNAPATAINGFKTPLNAPIKPLT